jgi:hypothetical protein
VAPHGAAHDEGREARFGGLAIGVDRDDALELLVVVHLAAHGTDRPETGAQVFEHAIVAEEYAAAADFERAVFGEEILDVVPLHLVDIVAI